MEVYYGSNEKKRTIIYAPYYFAGRSLNGIGFRFRFDFDFLDRLAKSRLSLENLTRKGWEIYNININHVFLDVLLSSLYSESEEKTKERAYEIIEIAEGSVSNIRNKKEYDDGYSDLDTDEEYLEDKWWNSGLEPPFFDGDIDWKEEDCQD